MYKSTCDICHQEFETPVKNKRSRNGYPIYFTCNYCYEWSVSKKDKQYAKQFSEIKGLWSARFKGSGKQFSLTWQSRYKGLAKRLRT